MKSWKVLLGLGAACAACCAILLLGLAGQLQALERSLAAFVGSSDAACAGGAAVDCTILEDLACAVPGEANSAQSGGCCTPPQPQPPG